jgi:hypothetical protein
MIKRQKIISISLVVFLLSCTGFLTHLRAQQDRYQDREHGRERKNKVQAKKDLKPVRNMTYKSTCEGCHFPYPPELLPVASWNKIINQLDQHFGEQVPIDPPSQEEISKYLGKSGADRSSTETAVNIIKSLKGQTPLRITEIPYIRGKHHEISKETLSRKAIGSLSNCIACHKKAEQGYFDDDNVTVPK